MKIGTDVHKCIGAGQCVTAAPAVFAQNEEDGMVIVLQDQPQADSIPAALAAIRLCPARAIFERD
jgi:ferredoxin